MTVGVTFVDQQSEMPDMYLQHTCFKLGCVVNCNILVFFFMNSITLMFPMSSDDGVTHDFVN